jgi:hypothetical protein
MNWIHGCNDLRGSVFPISRCPFFIRNVAPLDVRDQIYRDPKRNTISASASDAEVPSSALPERFSASASQSPAEEE